MLLVSPVTKEVKEIIAHLFEAMSITQADFTGDSLVSSIIVATLRIFISSSLAAARSDTFVALTRFVEACSENLTFSSKDLQMRLVDEIVSASSDIGDISVLRSHLS